MARPVRTSLDCADLRERFIAAGLRVLHGHGAAELTVRRVAEQAGSSTMGIYSRFGGRNGMLEAVYRRGFEQLRAALVDVPAGEDRIVGLALAYRRFALGSPALYALMFERPLPDFDPSPQLRADALGMTFTLLVDEVRQAQQRGTLPGDAPDRPAYLLWTAMHGLTSIELTHADHRPLPGWLIDSTESGEKVLTEGVRAVLSGLGATVHFP
ncbi:TetR/AcrR family transcriptional regulator [Virgisporangium aliadipatigenens]|uniref:TetR/AcrR family transcriptional regulator n=1 Tax=Virgisporangium aliadipatigenens TaxID=741659 RepID=UPI0019428946|nr:TetR/AcrR family transcriptional regulator [Virgisporangium aliadipatigenens]